METRAIILLFFTGMLGASIDAVAGGGGLITIPALLISGLDPVSAIATNKLQGAAGTVSAVVSFWRSRRISWRIGLPIALSAAITSIIGALAVHLLSRAILQTSMPIILVLVAIYFAAARRLSDDDSEARMQSPIFIASFVPIVAFYDGLFGPGAGSFYVIGFVGLLGFGVVKATAYTKLANAASNIGSLSLFIAMGVVVWPIGCAMSAGALVGGQIGSWLAMRFGARLVRPVLVVISCAMAVRLLFDRTNPVTQLLATKLRYFPFN